MGVAEITSLLSTISFLQTVGKKSNSSYCCHNLESLVVFFLWQDSVLIRAHSKVAEELDQGFKLSLKRGKCYGDVQEILYGNSSIVELLMQYKYN